LKWARDIRRLKMVPKTKIKFTYKDYLHMPEDKRYELIEGDFFMAPSPAEHHQRISGNLYSALRKFVQEHGLGFVYYAPFDVVLSEENVLQPDILFISKGCSEIITERNVQGAPDLIIEIISEATEYHDREIKQKLYARFGVKEYWLVDPHEKTVEVMVLGEEGFENVGIYKGEASLKSPILEGLPLDLKEVF
jgi:Uma2 family endonuclease